MVRLKLLLRFVFKTVIAQEFQLQKVPQIELVFLEKKKE